MEGCIHLRFAYSVEMHKMAVIGKKVCVGASSSATVLVIGEDVEIELIAGEYRIDCKWMVDIERIAGGFDMPPVSSAPDD